MNRLFEETFACPPRRSSSGTFKAPRRMRSSATTDDEPLDDIGEGEVFIPTKPRRYKSSEELDAALLSWDTEEDALRDHMVSSVCSDTEAMELDVMMDELSLSGKAQHKRPTNIMNTDSFGSNCSFYSIGSSMTLAQEMQPGRFITPMNSFTMAHEATNDTPAVWEAVQQQGRATVDPMKFVTADCSFRLPLVRKDSLKPKELTITKEKSASSSPVVEKGGLPTLPLNGPPLATPFNIDIHNPDAATENAETAEPPVQVETEESPRPSPPKFGLKRKSSIYRGA